MAKQNDEIEDILKNAAKESVANNPVNKIMKQRLKVSEELINEWNKFSEYVKPLIEGNKEISELLRKIGFKITLMPMTDLILFTAVGAERISMEMFKPSKMFCVKCLSEIKNE